MSTVQVVSPWPPLLLQLLLAVCDIRYASANWSKQCLLYQFHCSGALNTESNLFTLHGECAEISI